MSNFRIHYPVHYIAIGEFATGSGIPVHGVQSVTMNTSFNLENINELGQLEAYEIIEGLPEVDITAEKVLDGYPLMYHLASSDATSPTLVARTTKRSDFFLSVFSDQQDSSSGVPLKQVYCSGVYVNSLTYNFPVEGNHTESVNFVGNDKIWRSSDFAFDGHFDNTDAPASGVQRRQYILMGSGNSIWPTFISGIDGEGYNKLGIDGQYGAHIGDVSITTTVGRTDLLELGRLGPYYKTANFPVQVDTTINLIASDGDNVNASGDARSNVFNEQILVKSSAGYWFSLGERNKLSNVSYSGGDATGGNVNVSYTLTNFGGALTITAPNSDPAAFAHQV
jgi:hypothetical protein